MVISSLRASAGSSVAKVSLYNLFFSQVISSFLQSFIWAIILSFTHFIVHSFFDSFSQ